MLRTLLHSDPLRHFKQRWLDTVSEDFHSAFNKMSAETADDYGRDKSAPEPTEEVALEEVQASTSQGTVEYTLRVGGRIKHVFTRA